MIQLSTLTLSYDIPLRGHEVQLFRGAMVNAIGKDYDLMHNHGLIGYTYRYPCVQYKALQGSANIVCVAEGMSLVEMLKANDGMGLEIGDRYIKAKIRNVTAQQVAIGNGEEMYHYMLRNWLPLNTENYHLFQALKDDQQKNNMLERMLTGNILSMLKGLHIMLDFRLNTSISKILNWKMVKYKGLHLMSADILCSMNLNLPEYISVGKSASIGHGTIYYAARHTQSNTLTS